MNKLENKQSISFESGVQRLEQIVAELDQNNLSLEQALDLFREGIELVKYCNNLLDSAEAKVKVLIEDNKDEIIMDNTMENIIIFED